MDMSDSSTNMTMTMMKPWLHFTNGDNLLFKTWHPDSSGAIAGACIGLFCIALFERWLFAIRAGLEAYWRQRALAMTTLHGHFSGSHSAKTCCESHHGLASGSGDVKDCCGDDACSVCSAATTEGKPSSQARRKSRTVPPFIAAHDIPRGVIHAIQALLQYGVLMLAVMTFQAAYIISIILGLAIGEILFGRMASSGSHLLH